MEQHGPLRLGDLATREVITPPTVTRLVSSLQDRSLVHRVTDPEDGDRKRGFAVRGGGWSNSPPCWDRFTARDSSAAMN